MSCLKGGIFFDWIEISCIMLSDEHVVMRQTKFSELEKLIKYLTFYFLLGVILRYSGTNVDLPFFFFHLTILGFNNFNFVLPECNILSIYTFS